MRLIANASAERFSTSRMRGRSAPSQRLSTAPESAKPSIVSETIRNAKLLRSFAATMRWARTWVKSVTPAVVNARRQAPRGESRPMCRAP